MAECNTCGGYLSIEDKIRLSMKCDANGNVVWQGALLNPFDAWQSEGSVNIAGLKEAEWNNNTYAGGRTWISPKKACRQSGIINSIVLKTQAVNTAAWKFKLFRWNTTTSLYDMVVGSERSFNPTANASQTITFSTPVICEIGDIPSLFVPADNQLGLSNISGDNIYDRWALNTDVTTSSDFSGSSNTLIAQMDIKGFRPYATFVGDSILSGLNGGQSNWWMPRLASPLPSHVKTYPGGKKEYEPGYNIALIKSGLRYQNLGQTGETFLQALNSRVPEALLVQPKIMVLSFGTNDISAGYNITDTLTRLDSIKALCDGGTVTNFYVCEIIPRTGFNDTNAALIRTFNAAYAGWCTTNNATLIRTHDTLGQIRVSTGELDDLKTEYSADGTHLTLSGVQKFSEIIASVI